MSVIDYKYTSNGLAVTPFSLLDDERLLQILRVRNDERIRQWMDSQDEISLEDHLRFCQGMKGRDDAIYCAVESDDALIGVIYLTGIDPQHGIAELGLYKNPTISTTEKNIGERLMAILEGTAQSVGIQTLLLRVRLDNKRAITLYEKVGYAVTEQGRTHLHMKKEIPQ